MHNLEGMECFEKTVSEAIPGIEVESSDTSNPIKCVIILRNSVFVIDFFTLNFVMKQRSITNEIDTSLVLLVFSVKGISSEIKEEHLCRPHFV
jgi:hypothetical protein